MKGRRAEKPFQAKKDTLVFGMEAALIGRVDLTVPTGVRE